MPTKSQAAIFREAVKAITLLHDIASALLKGDKDTYSLADFTARFSKLEGNKTRLEDVYYEILDDDDLADDVENTYTSNFGKAINDYGEILVAFEKLSATSAQTNTPPILSTPTAVLPKIDLPKFSSRVEDWPSFISIFKSLTDEMSTVSDAVKLHYLLSCLSGEAYNMVSQLQPTNENYPVAMDILTRRYENRRVLIDRFVDIILGLPQIEARSDIRTVFLNPLISAQSALNNLALPIKNNDYVFVSIVVRKLKGELRTLFERKYGSRTTLPTLQNLIAFLEEHARCVETEWAGTLPIQADRQSPRPSTYQPKQIYSQPPRGPRQPAYQEFRPIPTSGGRQYYRPTQPAHRPAYSAQPNPARLKPTSPNSAHASFSNNMPCPYCKDRGHKLIACPQFNAQPVQGRWDFIHARNRCRRCLGPHYANECRSTKACKECGSENHHTSLHRPGAASPTHTSEHLLPPQLREQPRQRQAYEQQHYSAHARFSRPSSPRQQRSPSRSREGSKQQ